MTLRDKLKSKLEKDYARAPAKIWNKNNLEMKWDNDNKLYTGIDENGEEWIAALQRTRVPIFSVKCTIPQRKGDTELPCGGINFLAICNDEDKIKCRKCNESFTAKLNVGNNVKLQKMIQDLDGE